MIMNTNKGKKKKQKREKKQYYFVSMLDGDLIWERPFDSKNRMKELELF